MKGRVLIVAGSDSGGGAGIQADIKTVTALGAYAETALTAVTAQDTLAVHAIEPVSPALVARQIEVVLNDPGADAVKTGMLATGAIAAATADALERAKFQGPIVVDPVMAATSGTRLLDDDALEILKRRLIARAALVTPNIPEAERLLGRKIPDVGAMERAARDLLAFGARAVLLKGGHLEGPNAVDVLATEGRVERFESPRLESRNTHGTGCTLASAIATGLAQGLDLVESIARARAYVREAIRTAPGFGRGHGPLNHGHTVRPFEFPTRRPGERT
ncbi:MAG TPA: bifunctional hydroxymethylpyrimidine kinase/phosphomethylpyrimidine kinase [Alphaproteobacteria bacterium]|nr:bifunctional hydroxymethylpyrimidine kinase/phosphomethylpyrimidine kinase [Alphaproteobacteria bacterium]